MKNRNKKSRFLEYRVRSIVREIILEIGHYGYMHAHDAPRLYKVMSNYGMSRKTKPPTIAGISSFIDNMEDALSKTPKYGATYNSFISSARASMDSLILRHHAQVGIDPSFLEAHVFKALGATTNDPNEIRTSSGYLEIPNPGAGFSGMFGARLDTSDTLATIAKKRSAL
jgi:hypothetical protein